MNNLKDKIIENDTIIEKLKKIKEKSEKIIHKSIDDLNLKLEQKNENVQTVSYKYGFNKALYEDALFEEFKILFSQYHIYGTSWDSVREVLFSIETTDEYLEYTYATFLEALNVSIDAKFRRSNNYVTMVLNIFSREANFALYLYLIKKHFYNVFSYVNIVGYYGTRELQTCSFGQKCTAVVVTLLMSGVKPLVIDEPEAHLDNRLIAEYLIDLIKEKKLDRQLIFATHNANFVINGDAELIYILEVPDEGTNTVITATTIEDINNREKLLKLEGGKEAFEKREKKLLHK